MLDERLRKLAAHGVLEKTEFAEIPPRVEYAFTPLGKKFFGVLTQIEALERESQPNGAPDRGGAIRGAIRGATSG